MTQHEGGHVATATRVRSCGRGGTNVRAAGRPPTAEFLPHESAVCRQRLLGGLS